MNPIVKEKMAEYFRNDPQGAKRSFEIMAWRALALVMSIVGGLVVRYGESRIRELTADRIAMQRGLVAEADTVVSMRSDHDAVRRHVIWSSYPARVMLSLCRECLQSQNEKGQSVPRCGGCNLNGDGVLDARDINLLVLYVRDRYDGYAAAIEAKGMSVDELLSGAENLVGLWDDMETRLGE